MTGVHKRNGFVNVHPSDVSTSNVEDGRTTNKRHSKGKKRSLSQTQSSTSPARAFAYLIFGTVIAVGSVQFILNSIFFQTIHETTSGVPRAPLQEQLDILQKQLRELQEKAQVYVDDGNFYPFSIRDSRRLVPTQLPPEMHIWDYVDLKTQNQQKTKHADLFHNSVYQEKAVCQTYDLICYKKKIIQVFETGLEAKSARSILLLCGS